MSMSPYQVAEHMRLISKGEPYSMPFVEATAIAEEYAETRATELAIETAPMAIPKIVERVALGETDPAAARAFITSRLPTYRLPPFPTYIPEMAERAKETITVFEERRVAPAPEYISIPEKIEDALANVSRKVQESFGGGAREIAVAVGKGSTALQESAGGVSSWFGLPQNVLLLGGLGIAALFMVLMVSRK